jgi:hypothetical protein
MDSVSELWVTRSDWVSKIFCPNQPGLMELQDFLGIRGLKERCFYL